MQMNLTYGKKTFLIEVIFNPRKSLAISVFPDLRIIAKAPEGYTPETVKRRLTKRLPWINKQVDYFNRFLPLTPPRKYEAGETHYYLGRQYRLKIQTGKDASVRLIGRYFRITLPNTYTSQKVKALMLEWYSTHAKNILLRRITLWKDLFIRMGAPDPEIRFRRMKKRWGSCSGKGIIMLNTELVKAPIDCIDYVIVHELCHLLFPKHDSKFFSLLGKKLPDWKKRKERLEKVMIQ